MWTCVYTFCRHADRHVYQYVYRHVCDYVLDTCMDLRMNVWMDMCIDMCIEGYSSSSVSCNRDMCLLTGVRTTLWTRINSAPIYGILRIQMAVRIL